VAVREGRRTAAPTRAGRRVLRLREAGFGVAETLVALTLAGVLAGAIVGVLLRQAGRYGAGADSIRAGQALRAVVELAASELRAAAPADLVAAEERSVAVRFDLLRAVVCASDGSDVTTLRVYAEPSNANLPDGPAAAAFSRGRIFRFDADDRWSWTERARGDGGADPTPRAECLAAGAGSVPARDRDDAFLRVGGWSTHSEGVPARGALVRRYGILSYRIAPSSFGGGGAMWRNDQELVGLLDAERSRFAYLVEGTWRGSVAPSRLPEVTRIRLLAVVVGEGGNRHGVERRLSFEIPLRNR